MPEPLFPEQKSFGQFTRERYGCNWVFAARDTPGIHARYDKNDCPAVVIVPKQQKELRRDYEAAFGREYDVAAWQMLCALRDVLEKVAERDIPLNTLARIRHAIIGETT